MVGGALEVPETRDVLQMRARAAVLERDAFIFGSASRSSLLVAHDLFRKPVSTFRDHCASHGNPYAV